jgi:hypothetical protein
MSPTHPTSAVEYPDCVKYGTPTHIVRVEPGPPGYDKRTFICSACMHSEIVFVKYE